MRVEIITIIFCVILLDIVYSNSEGNALKSSEVATLFSEAADFLLLIGILTILTAIVAIGATWRIGTARNLLITSLLVVGFEFLVPMFFFQQLLQVQTELGLKVGPWIRFSSEVLSSILAFIGLWKLAL